MMYTYKHDTVTWIDLENPTREEVRDLIEQFGIDPLVGEELLNQTHRSKVDLHKDYIYLILHFPTQFNPKHTGVKHRIDEIDFIIGKDFIITTRYSSINALLEFSKIFESDSLLERKHLTKHAGFVFYHMIRNIYKSLYTKVEDIKTTLSVFEEQIFEGHEKAMVFELSKMSRVILYFRESLSQHKEILASFETAGQTLFEKDFQFYLRAVTGEYLKVENTIGSAKDYLHELRTTNDSLLSTKQNEIMKTLTVVNFIILPLSLITGLFGMNTDNNPIVGHSFDFWIIVLIMLLLTIISTTIFKRKNWL
jgi:magnesium transporter